MYLEYALLYPAKLSVYCGGQTHLSFSNRYHGVSWIKKADCSGTVEEIASENSDLLKSYIIWTLSRNANNNKRGPLKVALGEMKTVLPDIVIASEKSCPG